jgi:hypothetical protein
MSCKRSTTIPSAPTYTGAKSNPCCITWVPKSSPPTAHVIRITLNRHEFFVHHPHHGNEFGKPEVKHLRECLAAAGATLSRYDERDKG